MSGDLFASSRMDGDRAGNHLEEPHVHEYDIFRRLDQHTLAFDNSMRSTFHAK